MKNVKLYTVFTLILTGCVSFFSCEDKEYTPAMPEAKLINEITVDNFKSETLFLAVNMDSTLVLTITPADLDDKSVEWKSSDESIVKVSQDGKITGIAIGKAIVTVNPVLGFGPSEAVISIPVEVISEIIKATGIEFTNIDKDGNLLSELYQKDEIQLTYNILPDNHTYSHLTWKSSDEKVATVDENGVLTGVTPGEVTIYAYTHDKSGVLAWINLTILPYVPVEDVTIQPYNNKLHMHQELVLDYTYTPASATITTVNWTSSDENILKVTQGKVTAVGFGVATITATCIVNGNSASVSIAVDPGWYIWDKTNNFKGWEKGEDAVNFVIENGKMVVTMGEFTYNRDFLRGDIKQPVYSNNPIYLHWGQYPVFAMRTDLPKGAPAWDSSSPGGNYILDSKIIDKGGFGITTWEKDWELDLGDGTRMLYWNGPVYGGENIITNELSPHEVFQIKVVEVKPAGLPERKYSVYWIRTFKSEEEAKAFALSEVESEK